MTKNAYLMLLNCHRKCINIFKFASLNKILYGAVCHYYDDISREYIRFSEEMGGNIANKIGRYSSIEHILMSQYLFGVVVYTIFPYLFILHSMGQLEMKMNLFTISILFRRFSFLKVNSNTGGLKCFKMYASMI